VEQRLVNILLVASLSVDAYSSNIHNTHIIKHLEQEIFTPGLTDINIRISTKTNNT